MINKKKRGNEKREYIRDKLCKYKLFLFIFLVLLLLGTFNAQFIKADNAEEYKPYLHAPTVGEHPKLETFGEYNTALFPGAGTYTYTIQIPRGTRGIQPSVSLLYNSQSAIQRPSIIGSGWDLTENYILRDVNHTLDDASDDYFILVIENSKYKIFFEGLSHKTEIDPHRFKIENSTNDGHQYWIVTLTDGTRYRFGYNNDSFMDSNTGRIYGIKWSLDLIEDTHGNKIYYSYNEDPYPEDNGAVYLSNITYNNDQLRLISFEYENEARPDMRLVFEQGNRLEESRRLKDIYIYYDSSLVRRYNLDYTNLNNEKSLSSLSSITYYGNDNLSILNTVTFGYYPSIQGFDNTTNNWVVAEEFAFSSRSSTGKDYGVRLIDVNNDGFPDLVKAQSSNKVTKLNNKIDGWDSTSNFVMPVEIVDGNNNYQGVMFADVNSDGLIDVLEGQDSTKKVYINDGDGWSYDSSWSLPVSFISGGEDQGVRLVDINGDGKVDILEAREPSTKNVYINAGTGWESSSGWDIPDYFVNDDNKDNGLRVLDFNNDRLQDLIKGGIPGSAWMNNASGWVNYSQYAPNISFTDIGGDRPDLGVRFMELNGDGLIDMLQNHFSNVSYLDEDCYNQTNSTEECTFYNASFSTNTRLNNGTGWIASEGWLSPEWFTHEGYNIGRRIADVNGDGYPDIVVAYQNATFESITHIKNATNAFLLKNITNAYGGVTQVDYEQSTLSENNQNLGFNIWLVANATTNNSLMGDFNINSMYSYSYYGGKFDYTNSEFRGFNLVNETFPDNSITMHYFHQDDILKGKEYQTSIYDENGKHYRNTFNLFTYSSDNKIYLNETSVHIYYGNPNAVVNNVSLEYDNYGNVIQINSSGNIDMAGDEKLEVFSYFYNITGYIVNKMNEDILYDSDYSTIVKKTNYYYDNSENEVGKGDLTKVINYNDNGDDSETQYTYDSYGNILTEIEPLGYVTTYTYDDTGTYRIKEVNELGHSVDYDYDEGTGNLLSEIRHGFNRTLTYDMFGRIESEIISPDNSNYPTKKYNYSLDGVAPEMIKIENKKDDGDYSETVYIYDGLRNPVQIRTLFDSGTQIVKNYFYDNKLRIYEEQNPYFESYSSSIIDPSSEPKIKYTYDALDRVINLTKQDNSAIIIVFNQTNITQYDENNNRIVYTTDAYDRITNVYEYNLNSIGQEEIYETNYDYSADNNIIKIRDNDDNEFIFEYDTLGRRIVMDDPDMENWTYSYDLNGNLINQTDGNGDTIILEYDKLNRIESKISDDTNISFIYDMQYNNTLSNITFNSSFFNEFRYGYDYDNRLRIVEEHAYVLEQWIITSTDYDSSDKITQKYLPSTTLTYDYNKIGKIININGYVDDVSFNAFGSVVNRTYANTLITNFNYDDINRITNLNTASLQNLSYSYDNVGNVKSINDMVNSKVYAMNYDSLNRLINTTIDGDDYIFEYSPIASMLSYNESEDVNVGYKYDNLPHAPSNVTGLYFSNLSVNFNWPENDSYINSDILTNVTFNATENSLCWIYLQYDNSTQNITEELNFSASIRANITSAFGFNYSWRDDLTYEFNLTCYDYFGISDTEVIRFTVDTPEIRICRDLTVDGRQNYTLLNDILSDTTCLNIQAENTTINGNGHTIYYAQSSSGNGVYTNGHNNITFINGNINMNDTTKSNSVAMKFINGSFYNITNNSLTVQGPTLSDAYNHGIYLEDIFNSFIINNQINLLNKKGNGIYLYNEYNEYSHNNIIQGNIIYTGATISHGIYLYGQVGGGSAYENLIMNNIINTENSNSLGIYLNSQVYENILENNDITTSSSSSRGIYISRGYNNIIRDSVIDASLANDVELSTNAINNIFLNVTYDTEAVYSSSELIRKWYFDAQVNNTNGDPINQANITGYNVTDIEQFSELTNTEGKIIRQEVVEYVNHGGLFSYYNNYTLIASKDGYATDNRTINITTNQDLNIILYLPELVFNLTELYQEDTFRIFGFILRNTVNTNSNFSWELDTGESNITSQYDINLTNNEDIFNYIEYNYTTSGTYNVTITAYYGNFSDSETIEVEVS